MKQIKTLLLLGIITPLMTGCLSDSSDSEPADTEIGRIADTASTMKSEPQSEDDLIVVGDTVNSTLDLPITPGPVDLPIAAEIDTTINGLLYINNPLNEDKTYQAHIMLRAVEDTPVLDNIASVVLEDIKSSPLEFTLEPNHLDMEVDIEYGFQVVIYATDKVTNERRLVHFDKYWHETPSFTAQHSVVDEIPNSIDLSVDLASRGSLASQGKVIRTDALEGPFNQGANVFATVDNNRLTLFEHSASGCGTYSYNQLEFENSFSETTQGFINARTVEITDNVCEAYGQTYNEYDLTPIIALYEETYGVPYGKITLGNIGTFEFQGAAFDTSRTYIDPDYCFAEMGINDDSFCDLEMIFNADGTLNLVLGAYAETTTYSLSSDSKTIYTDFTLLPGVEELTLSDDQQSIIYQSAIATRVE